MLFRRISSAVCLLFFTLSAFGQGKPPSDEIPEDALLYFFFVQITAKEDFADQVRAAGNNPEQIYRGLEQDTGLSRTERVQVEGMARSCNVSIKSYETQNDQALTQSRDRLSAGGAGYAEAQRDLDQLQAGRKAVLGNCVTQLKERLGNTRFDQLVSKLRVSMASMITRLSPSTGEPTR